MSLSEKDQAIRLANAILERPNADPDDDLAVLSRQFLRALEANSSMRDDVWKDFIECRGVQTPCKKCDGLGVIVYGSTATWRGGIGGAAMTNGVCNHCWGSGDEHRHWLDLRKLAD